MREHAGHHMMYSHAGMALGSFNTSCAQGGQEELKGLVREEREVDLSPAAYTYGASSCRLAASGGGTGGLVDVLGGRPMLPKHTAHTLEQLGSSKRIL
ncbi:unnamed protein product [Boreogadus saida]